VKTTQPMIRPDRDESQRGSVMVVSMVTLVGLLGLGGLALLASQSDLSGATQERFQAVALHAAEAGVAATMDELRMQHDPNQHWTALVMPENAGVTLWDAVAGNGAQPGDAANLFSSDRQSWYEVDLRNNVSDPGFVAGEDDDSRVVIRSTGHGPDGARVVLEVEVSGSSLVSDANQMCAGYGQRGLDADGSGRDDCMGVVDSGSTVTFRPNS
jgi:hypothetical protein